MRQAEPKHSPMLPQIRPAHAPAISTHVFHFYSASLPPNPTCTTTHTRIPLPSHVYHHSHTCTTTYTHVPLRTLAYHHPHTCTTTHTYTISTHVFHFPHTCITSLTRVPLPTHTCHHPHTCTTTHACAPLTTHVYHYPPTCTTTCPRAPLLHTYPTFTYKPHINDTCSTQTHVRASPTPRMPQSQPQMRSLGAAGRVHQEPDVHGWAERPTGVLLAGVRAVQP